MRHIAGRSEDQEEESRGDCGSWVTGRLLGDGRAKQACRKWCLYVGLGEVPEVSVAACPALCS